jgi:hypothetical protein
MAFFHRIADHVGVAVNGKTAFATWPPYAESMAFAVMGDDPDARATASVTGIGVDYFAVLRMKVQQGRAFTALDREGTEHVAVISEGLARRLWPSGSALGRRIRVVEQLGTTTPAETGRTIVGIVNDVRRTYGDPDVSDVYVPFYQMEPQQYVAFFIESPADPRTLATLVRTSISATDPFAVVRDVIHVDDENRQLTGTRVLTTMLTAFTAVAASLAMVGLYGVIAYAVGQRRREFAIRIALGATRAMVTTDTMRGGGRVLIAGLVAGTLVTRALGRLLQHRLYGVPAFDVWSLTGAALLFGAAGVAAIWLPARRAGLVNPVEALNTD